LREALDGNQRMAALTRLEADATDEASGGQARILIGRVRNLGSDRWDIWSKGQAGSILEELDDDDWRTPIFDIGTLGNPEEKSPVAQAVLEDLWARRNDRRPVLIVIEEAHNICTQVPDSALHAMASGYAARIAAEVRKFGLYRSSPPNVAVGARERPLPVQQAHAHPDDSAVDVAACRDCSPSCPQHCWSGPADPAGLGARRGRGRSYSHSGPVRRARQRRGRVRRCPDWARSR
jgi:hypothetical protein